jgi:hypothetical protein
MYDWPLHAEAAPNTSWAFQKMPHAGIVVTRKNPSIIYFVNTQFWLSIEIFGSALFEPVNTMRAQSA